MVMIRILLLVSLFITSGCLVGNTAEVPIGSPDVIGDLSGIKINTETATADIGDVEAGNLKPEGDVAAGGDVVATKVTVGGGSDSIALCLSIVSLFMSPYLGALIYRYIERPRRIRKEAKNGHKEVYSGK